MTYTLAQAALDTAEALKLNVVKSAATGGSATTLIDTGFPYAPDGVNVPADDFYNFGTIWFISGSRAGTGYTSNVITDWARSTKTFTMVTGTAVAAGNLYAVCDREYPRYVLWQGVNWALQEIGGVSVQNTSLTTVANQENYDLPTGVYNVKVVEIANLQTAPNDYVVVHNWYELNNDLFFKPESIPSIDGRTIRLTYLPRPAELTADTGTIPDIISRELVRWGAAVYCLGWKLQQVGVDDKIVEKKFAEALGQFELAKMKYKPQIGQFAKTNNVSIWSGKEW